MSKLLLAAGMALICGTAAWGKNNVPDFRYLVGHWFQAVVQSQQELRHDALHA